MNPVSPAPAYSERTDLLDDDDFEHSQRPATMTLFSCSKVSNADANGMCNVNTKEIPAGRATAPSELASESRKRSITVLSGQGSGGMNSLADTSASESEMHPPPKKEFSDFHANNIEKNFQKTLKSPLTGSSAGKCVPRNPEKKADTSIITANSADEHNYAVSWVLRGGFHEPGFNNKMNEFSASSFSVSNKCGDTPKSPEKSLADSSAFESATPNTTTKLASTFTRKRTRSSLAQTKQKIRTLSDAEIDQMLKKPELLTLEDIIHFNQNDRKLLRDRMLETFIFSFMSRQMATAAGILAAGKKLNVELSLSQYSIRKNLSDHMRLTSSDSDWRLSEFKLLVDQLKYYKIDTVNAVLETLYKFLLPHNFLSEDLSLQRITEFADYAQSVSGVNIGVWMKDLILTHVDYAIQHCDDHELCILDYDIELYLERARSLGIKLDDLSQRNAAASFQHLFDRAIEEALLINAVTYIEMDHKWNFGLVIPDSAQIKEALKDRFHHYLEAEFNILSSPYDSSRSSCIEKAYRLIQVGMYLKISFGQDVKELAIHLLNLSSGSEKFSDYLKIARMVGVHENEYS